ncbi:transposase [Cecembia calidifontis]|uniref:REP element-mobilizing transposase RayT n=1 Tax=Cecembia calidifontis TaxID=1187080 RepID=A0A4Q7PB65_9BACT|nr:transposase [Cecembia calidifontis]RZS96022.1 REP element-mobilizing transposase RayT [Cecembia calidifontis]
MKHSHSEIWMHLVLSTKNQIPIFGNPEAKCIGEAIEEFASEHSNNAVSFAVLPEHIHILLKLPEDMSLNGLVSHLQTFIQSKMRKNELVNSNFQWEKDYHAHSVSINRLTTERSVIQRQNLKHKEMSFKEELKFLGL